MVLEAAGAYGMDLARSYFVGDKSADIECGQRAGARTILVLTGYGAEQDCQPDFTAADMAEAVEIVLRDSGERETPLTPPFAPQSPLPRNTSAAAATPSTAAHPSTPALAPLLAPTSAKIARETAASPSPAS